MSTVRYGIYSILSREITKYTVIYGAYIRSWPTLKITINIFACSGMLQCLTDHCTH